MKTEIESTLSVLVGLPLWAVGKASSMAWFQFGARVHAPTPRSPDRITGEYALHLQCPWRITEKGEIRFGSHDIFRPRDPSLPSDDESVDRPGCSWFDRRAEEFNSAAEARPLRVRLVTADPFGGFALQLDRGVSLEVFPDSSAYPQTAEHWRLLRPGADSPHFVVTNHGRE
jgi:hypothetical protein